MRIGDYQAFVQRSERAEGKRGAHVFDGHGEGVGVRERLVPAS